jgi:hypothetical protein
MSAETYGYPAEVWSKAKEEAVRAIVRKRSPIFYSDLTRRISSVAFGPHDYSFHYLLYEISKEEDAAGRGMISALVVRQEDGLPGQGFFDLARELGRDVSDRIRCWNDETRIVLDHCENHPWAG